MYDGLHFVFDRFSFYITSLVNLGILYNKGLVKNQQQCLVGQAVTVVKLQCREELRFTGHSQVCE